MDMNAKISAILCTATLTLVMAGPVSFAQAPGKATGNYNFWDAQGWQQHAQTQARSLYYYSQTPTPTPEKAKEHALAARTGVVSAQKSLAELKKGNPDNKEAQASITKLEAMHTKLVGHCDMVEKAIAKGEHIELAACCANMFHDIEAANAEMAKLQKALKIPAAELPRK